MLLDQIILACFLEYEQMTGSELVSSDQGSILPGGWIETTEFNPGIPQAPMFYLSTVVG